MSHIEPNPKDIRNEIVSLRETIAEHPTLKRLTMSLDKRDQKILEEVLFEMGMRKIGKNRFEDESFNINFL